MNICDDLARACRDIGLDFQCHCDRIQPRYELALKGEPEAPVLHLCLRNEHDVAARLLDLDLERRGLVLEVGIKTVKREDNFGLWLEDEECHRHIVMCVHGEWVLAEARGSETVEEVLSD